MSTHELNLHAVVPIAGLGTRVGALFAKRSPEIASKALASVGGIPVILRTAKELHDSGVANVTFVLNRGHIGTHWLLTCPEEALEDIALLRKPELTSLYSPYLEALSKLDVSIAYQSEPRGLGHAVWSAHNIVATVAEGSPIVVVLPDDMFLSDELPIKLLVEAYKWQGEHPTSPVILLKRFRKDVISRFGVVVPKDADLSCSGVNLISIEAVEEKPKLPKSDLAIMGRYVLPFKIFDILSSAIQDSKVGHNGEIQLTDAIDKLKAESGSLYGCIIEGLYLDCGTALGFAAAQLAIEAHNSKRASIRRISEILQELGYQYS